MDKIIHYRQVIESIFKEYARLFNQQPTGVEVIAVCDETTDTYAVLNLGWDGKERVNATSVLMRIVNGKIWVEAENSLYGFVDELVEAGIPKSDIVLTLQPPKMRQYTDFAVA